MMLTILMTATGNKNDHDDEVSIDEDSGEGGDRSLSVSVYMTILSDETAQHAGQKLKTKSPKANNNSRHGYCNNAVARVSLSVMVAMNVTEGEIVYIQQQKEPKQQPTTSKPVAVRLELMDDEEEQELLSQITIKKTSTNDDDDQLLMIVCVPPIVLTNMGITPFQFINAVVKQPQQENHDYCIETTTIRSNNDDGKDDESSSSSSSNILLLKHITGNFVLRRIANKGCTLAKNENTSQHLRVAQHVLLRPLGRSPSNTLFKPIKTATSPSTRSHHHQP